MQNKKNLLNFSRPELRKIFAESGEQAFRADQIIKWVHQKQVTNFDEMTNLSKKLREYLTENFEIVTPNILLDKASDDGTRKWLINLGDKNSIETVYIPENDRGTLCVSSQVGCALNCTFCSTAAQGFNRNLSVAEIIGQVYIAKRELQKQDRKITNVVMMGMGEPLMNYSNVLPSMDLMLDDLAYGLSKYRVTLSTSGVVPEMKKLKQDSPVALAVSLHAPTDALRNKLVPINKKYPLKELLEVCRDYYSEEKRRKVTIEYVMLDGVNDSLNEARELAKILSKVRCKINLIPFNPFERTLYKTSKKENILKFKKYLEEAGFITTVRATRGDEIDAACGQLKGNFVDKTPRSRIMKKEYYDNQNSIDTGHA